MDNRQFTHVIFYDRNRLLYRRKKLTEKRKRIVRRYGVDALIDELSMREGERFDMHLGCVLPANCIRMPKLNRKRRFLGQPRVALAKQF